MVVEFRTHQRHCFRTHKHSWGGFLPATPNWELFWICTTISRGQNHTYTHAHTFTHIHTHMHARTHTYTHTHTNTHTNSRFFPLFLSVSLSHTHTHTHTLQHGRHNEKRASYGHALLVDPWGKVLADKGRCVAVSRRERQRERWREVECTRERDGESDRVREGTWSEQRTEDEGRFLLKRTHWHMSVLFCLVISRFLSHTHSHTNCNTHPHTRAWTL